MADARYVIDLIINARDNTAAALASATAGVKAFEKVAEDNERQNERTRKSFAELTTEIRSQEAKLKDLSKEMGVNERAIRASADQMANLEKASRNYVKTLNDSKASEAETAQALLRREAAEKNLNEALKKGTALTRERREAIVANISLTAQQIQQTEELRKAEADASTERRKATTAYVEEARKRLQANQNATKDELKAHNDKVDAEIAGEKKATTAFIAEAKKRLEATKNSNREELKAHNDKLNAEIAAEKAATEKFNTEARKRLQAVQNANKEEISEHNAKLDAEIAGEKRAADEYLKNARTRLAAIQNTTKDEIQAHEDRIAAQERELKLGEDYVRQLDQITNLEVQRAQAARKGDTVAVAKVELQTAGLVAEAEATRAELKAVFDKIPIDFDVHAAGATAELTALYEVKRLLDGSSIDLDVDVHGAARAAAEMRALKEESGSTSKEMGFLSGLMSTVSDSFSSSSSTVSSFDNYLRGLMSLGVAVFFNQLILLAGAAASAFLALASSAAVAGAAIGGALTAGVAQAIPAVGLLVAAMSRVKAVMAAAKQAELLKQQQSYQGAKQDKASANAADQIKSAEERLADAHRRVTAAQDKLNDSREQAADKLRDLIFQERGLSLTMQDTQDAIKNAIQEGDVSALPRLQLQRDQTKAQLGDVREDIAGRKAGDVPEIQQAQEGLKDAQRAVADAERGLVRARRSAAETEAGVTAAAGKLDYLLGKFSDAELRLYKAIQRLQETWRKFAQEATEPLINAFTVAVDRVNVLLQDKRIINAAKGLATGMATEFSRIFKEFSSGPALGQMLRIIDQSKANLKPLGDIAINIGHAFLDIAEAAGPTLTNLLKWVRDITDGVAEFFSQGRKSGDLQKFFKDGATQLKAWGDLLWAVIKLFAAIAGPGGGAKTGLQLVRDLAKAIGSWAEAIKTPGTKLNEFFQRFFRLGRQMLDVMTPVFAALADGFNELFSEEGLHSVEGFAIFLSQVLIPALVDFAKWLGTATAYIGDFAKAHPEITKIAFAMLGATLAAAVFVKALSIFIPLFKAISFIGEHALGPLLSKLPLVARIVSILGRVFAGLTGGPVLIIIGLIVGLLAISGKLDDVWRKIVSTGKRIWKEIQPGIEELKKSFEGIADTISKGGGLISVLKFIGYIISEVLMSVIDALGDQVAGVFNGIARIVSGFVKILDGVLKIFRGDFKEGFSEILEGVVNIFRGLGDMIWGVIKGIGGMFGDLAKGLGKSILDGLMNGLASLSETVINFFMGVWEDLLKFFGVMSPSTLAMDLGEAIIQGLWAGIKAAWNAIGDLAGWIWDKISDGFKALGGAYKKLASYIIGKWVDFLKLEIRGLRAIGRWIWDKIEDGLHAVVGAIKKVAGWIIDKWLDYVKLEIRAIKAVGTWIWNAIKDAIHAAGHIASEIASWLWDKFIGFIKLEIRGLKNIGTWIWNAINDSVTAIVGKFKDIGGAIITGIIEGLKESKELVKDALSWVIDNVPGGKLIRKGLGVVGIELAAGGPIPGYGGGDVIPAMLEPGEHVFTKEEVTRAGGHDVIFALRALLGGGGQGGPFGYSNGGPPTAQQILATQGVVPKTEDPQKRKRTLSEEREDYKRSGEERARDWRTMWNDMLTTTRRATNDIEKQVREMRVGTTTTMRRMRTDITKILNDIVDVFDREGKTISDMWAATFTSLKKVTHEGLTYIGHETNKALTALGANHINFGLTAPATAEPDRAATPHGAAGAATGGMVGLPGERGHDGVRTVLGRGEAVLNYAHQAYVEPALHAFYGHGLADTFKRVRGYHAGGPESRGYAAGGMVELGNTGRMVANQQLARTILSMMRRYHFAISAAGEGGHASNSDHHWGGAIDIVPGAGGSWAMLDQLAKAAGWRPNDPMPSSGPFRWIGWDTEGGGHGDPAHGGNHLHLSWNRDGPFTGPGGTGAAIEDIKRVLIEGIEPLKDLGQKALDLVRKAANEKISDTSDAQSGSTVALGPGGAGQQIFDYFVARGFSPEQSAAFVGNFVQESRLDPGAVQPNGQGHGLAQWGGDRFNALQAFAKTRGTPWQDMQTQLDFVWAELQGAESSAYQAIKSASSLREAVDAVGGKYERFGIAGDRMGPAQEALQQYRSSTDHGPRRAASGGIVGKDGGEFADGGTVPGGPGEPVSIIAHAGEWILNARQQNAVAEMLGTSVGKLRDFMGFTGGPTSFQGGGTPTGSGKKPLTDRQRVEGSPELAGFITDLDEVMKTLRDLKKKNVKNKLDKFIEAIRQLTMDEGVLDDLTTGIEALGNRLQRSIDLAKVGLQRVGGKLVKRNPLVDAAKIADEAVDMYADLGIALRKQREVAHAGLLEVKKKIAEIKGGKGGLTKKEKASDEYEKLLIAQKDFRNALDTSDAAIAENRANLFQAQTDRFEAQTAAALRPSSLAKDLIAARQRLFSAFGNDEGLAQAGVEQLAELQKNQKTLQDRYAAAAKKAAKDPRWQSEADQLLKDLNDVNGQVAEQTHANLQAGLEAVNKRYAAKSNANTFESRWQTAFGRSDLLAGIAQQNIDNMKDNLAELQGELAKASAADDQGLASTIRDQISELRISIAEATSKQFQDSVDAINKTFERRSKSNEFARRLATAFGQSDLLAGLAQQSIDNMKDNVTALQTKLQEATAAGNADAVEQLGDQIKELQASIAEAAAQQFQNAIDAVEKEAARQETILGLQGRLADLRERTGGRLEAIRDRQAIGATRGNNLATERAGLAGLLAQAVLARNADKETDKEKELREKIADLDVTIAEQTQATKDLVFTYRQAVADIIATRTSRITGLFDTASQIIQKVGAAIGTVDLPALRALLVRTGETLRTASKDIAKNVRDAMGDFGGQGATILGRLATAFQQGPREFATVLAQLGPAIEALEAGMSTEQKAAFAALIDSMSGNTLAVLDNTDQIKQLNGTGGQSFSSSLWQIFRQAAFSGGGALRPEYQFPQMQSGGYIHRTGLYNLHAGEVVVPASQVNAGGALEQNLYITNPTEVADPDYIFAVAEFNRSNRRAT